MHARGNALLDCVPPRTHMHGIMCFVRMVVTLAEIVVGVDRLAVPRNQFPQPHTHKHCVSDLSFIVVFRVSTPCPMTLLFACMI